MNDLWSEPREETRTKGVEAFNNVLNREATDIVHIPGTDDVEATIKDVRYLIRPVTYTQGDNSNSYHANANAVKTVYENAGENSTPAIGFAIRKDEESRFEVVVIPLSAADNYNDYIKFVSGTDEKLQEHADDAEVACYFAPAGELRFGKTWVDNNVDILPVVVSEFDVTNE